MAAGNVSRQEVWAFSGKSKDSFRFRDHQGSRLRTSCLPVSCHLGRWGVLFRLQMCKVLVLFCPDVLAVCSNSVPRNTLKILPTVLHLTTMDLAKSQKCFWGSKFLFIFISCLSDDIGSPLYPTDWLARNVGDELAFSGLHTHTHAHTHTHTHTHRNIRKVGNSEFPTFLFSRLPPPHLWKLGKQKQERMVEFWISWFPIFWMNRKSGNFSSDDIGLVCCILEGFFQKTRLMTYNMQNLWWRPKVLKGSGLCF